MKVFEFEGKSVDEALKNALNELKLTKDEIEYEILDEGHKGFLNLGNRPAKIKVKVKKDYSGEAKKFLRSILDSMGIMAEIRIKEEDDTIKISLAGPDMGILIGYRGETLDSLQYLVSLVVNKGNENGYKRIILDTENYRVKREETLKRLAARIAQKVKSTGRQVKLEPMNPYERRIIHSALQGDLYVETHSEGEEPYRRVVVDLKKKA